MIKEVSSLVSLRRYLWILAAGWTITLIIFIVWDTAAHNEDMLEIARHEARIAYDKDVLFRSWVSEKGGIYVPVTASTPPNPYLRDFPDRDITTPSGKQLTLMNPAYATRQIHELQLKRKNIRGHLTSLKPIRPENGADPWETEALKKFETGVSEVNSIEKIDGQSYMRLMRPLFMEVSCMKCHAGQGYKVGDIRGGISVSIPIKPILDVSRHGHISHIAWHSIIWLIGMGILLSGYVGLRGQIYRREQIETELHESNEKFEDFFYMNPEACAILTLDGVLLDVNQATVELSEYPKEELLGKNVSELHAWADRDEQLGVFGELLNHGEVHNKGTKFRKKSGVIVNTLFSAQLIEISGEKRILSITRDITEIKSLEESLRKAKQEAESANTAKSEFLAHMSHEIRTPMNTTLGAAELLAETSLTSEQQQYVDMFRRSSEHLLSLINDILDLSKIESGHIELENIGFNLRQTIDKLVGILGIKANEKQLKLRYNIAPDTPLNLTGDPSRLNQVLLNLVGNALKFTKKGEVLISVRLNRVPEGGDKAELAFSVSDTGIGIPADRIDRLFQSFVQAESSTTRQYGGTGLGLVISKKLVNLMGGDIRAESNQAQGKEGSTFSFTAVFGLSHGEEPVGDKAEQPARTTNLNIPGPLNILIADDSEDSLEIMKLYLRGQPVTIDTAGNGEIAVEKVKTAEYGLILMDLQMPVMDGYGAIREIRRWEQENGRKPAYIIALSANAFKEYENMAFRAGCDEYIVKPIRKNKLFGIINDATGKRGLI